MDYLAEERNMVKSNAARGTVTISPIELVALKKLAIVSHMLASQLENDSASGEQRALVRVLDHVIARAEGRA